MRKKNENQKFSIWLLSAMLRCIILHISAAYLCLQLWGSSYKLGRQWAGICDGDACSGETLQLLALCIGKLYSARSIDDGDVQL